MVSSNFLQYTRSNRRYLYNSYIARIVTSRMQPWVGHVDTEAKTRYMCRTWVGKPLGRRFHL